MAIHEGLDIDNDLLAHINAPFDRRRAGVRQQDDLTRAGELDQLWIDRRLMFEHVEPGTGNLIRLDQASEGVLVNNLAARCVDDIGL